MTVPMLDLRIYRAAFIPVVLALVVVAFSLQPRPRPIETTLAPDAFLGDRATSLLEDLARRYPHRAPGSAGDMAVAGVAARAFRAAGLRVSVQDREGRTIDGDRTIRTVVGERPGLLSSRIVVVAHRDAATSPAAADLSGTAALLELARLYEGRSTRRTLTLVSTSGGSGGDAGAAQWADAVPGRVDAVIVLGDLAGAATRRPQVVGWSDASGIAPQRLMRTVEQAIRDETAAPGAASPPMQALRLAFPLTVSEQGPILARGLPAVLVGASGELGPPGGDGVSAARMDALGRAVLRSLTALDNAPEIAPPGPRHDLVVHDQVLPGWAVRLLAGVLLLPALLTALDGLARVRRRGARVLRWVGWLAVGGLPFLATGVVLVLLRLVGLVNAPGEPVLPGVVPVSIGTVAVAAALLALGFLVARPRLVRALGLGVPGEGGAAAAVGLTTVLLTLVVWLRNPYTAWFLLPAAHLWLLAVSPELRVARPWRVGVVLLGLVPLALAALVYGLALGAGPIDLAWMAVLLVAGGHVTLWGLVLWSVGAGCALGALLVAVRARSEPEGPRREEVRSRGPLTYAGPGSLGGTDSALRR